MKVSIVLVVVCFVLMTVNAMSAPKQKGGIVKGINPSVIVNIAKDVRHHMLFDRNDVMLTMLMQIWDLIEGNKPVVDIDTDYANGYDVAMMDDDDV